MSRTNRVEMAVDEVMGLIHPHLIKQRVEIETLSKSMQALRKDLFEILDSLSSDAYGEGYSEGIDSERFWGRMTTGDPEK